MGFEPGIEIGDVLLNQDVCDIFRCGNMGGMRRSKKTNTLVIISDMTKGFYHDQWKDGILLYTGMGKYGDQVLRGNQNITLYESDSNGVDVHLFEVQEKTRYTYKGQVKLVSKPYQTDQPDEEGRIRKVWIFPIKPINEIDELDELENPNPAKIGKLPVKELVLRSQKLSAETQKQIRTETIIYRRDPYLKEAVKRIAEGKCQLCKENAPFLDHYGEPYLEEHHVKRLADGGEDTIGNVVAICPNCHRKVHILNRREDVQSLEQVAEENVNKLQVMLGYQKIQK